MAHPTCSNVLSSGAVGNNILTKDEDDQSIYININDLTLIARVQSSEFHRSNPICAPCSSGTRNKSVRRAGCG